MILDKLFYSNDEVAEMFEVKRTRVSNWVREVSLFGTTLKSATRKPLR